MLAYLNAHPEINCRAADVIRSMPAGGPDADVRSAAGRLRPRSVHGCNGAARLRGNGAFEREQNADQRLAYVDFIADQDPDFTMKHQILYDNINSFKDSFLPYGENQYIKSIENKFTVTKRVSDDNLPEWVRVNMLGSLNYRQSVGLDQELGRRLRLAPGHQLQRRLSLSEHDVLDAADEPGLCNRRADTGFRSSKFDNTGLGVMFDIDLFTNTNVLIGGRYDTSDARATDMPRSTPTRAVRRRRASSARSPERVARVR